MRASTVENEDCIREATAVDLINLEEAERFLTLLDEGEKRFTFQTFDDNRDRNDRTLTRILHGSLSDHGGELRQRSHAGAGVYVTVNRTDLLGRKKENIVAIRAVWQECDDPEVPNLPLAPHIVVQSSPGKYHRYILTDGGALNEFNAVQARLVQDYGSDKNAADITRVLRLPGFPHQKVDSRKGLHGDTHMVRIIQASCEQPLPWAKVKEIFPPVKDGNGRSAPLHRCAPTPGGFVSKKLEIQSALNHLDPDMEYRDWLMVGMALHAGSGGSLEGLTEWQAWSAKGDKYQEGVCEDKWSGFNLDGGIKLSSLFGMAYENGWNGKSRTESNVARNGDTTANDDEARFAELAELSPVEYDRKRNEVAKEMDIRLGVLDKEVNSRRKSGNSNAVDIEDVEPWPEPVDAGVMMTELLDTIREHIQISEPKRIAIALWIIFTFLHDSAPISPMLAVTSPSKRCGKTTFLSLLTHLCSRALPTNNITSAALFRVVEKYGPTLLIDEGDTFLGQNDELRGIINSGHTRLTAWVIRNTGDDHEPTRFTTWAPKAIAMIKHPPDTIQDRSIEIRMERKRPEDRIKRLRLDATPKILTLRRKVARFSQDNEAAFKRAKPVLPDSLHDRAKDNWEPLIAIAELIGGEWVTRAIEAAKTLTPGEDNAANILLLEDCQRLFKDREYYQPTDLCDALVKLEDRPWSDWYRGRPITSNRMGRMISDFKTRTGHEIKSHSGRSGTFAGRAYWKDDFEDAFSRYLSSTLYSVKKNGTPAQVNNGAGFSDSKSGTLTTDVPESNPLKPNNAAGCADVPEFSGDIREKHKNRPESNPEFEALFPSLDTSEVGR